MEPKHHTTTTSRLYSQLPTILGLSLAALVITALVFWFNKSPIDISPTVRSSASFTIVTPRRLPAGTVVVAQPTYDSAKNILVTNLKAPGNKGDIVLSQQSKPKDTDLKQIDAQEAFLSNVGSVYILKGEAGRIQVIVDMNDSWMLINASKNVGTDYVKRLINDLG